VVASGTAPLSYQWFQNSAPLAYATSASFTTSATVIGNNGESFMVHGQQSGRQPDQQCRDPDGHGD